MAAITTPGLIKWGLVMPHRLSLLFSVKLCLYLLLELISFAPAFLDDGIEELQTLAGAEAVTDSSDDHIGRLNYLGLLRTT